MADLSQRPANITRMYKCHHNSCYMMFNPISMLHIHFKLVIRGIAVDH